MARAQETEGDAPPACLMTSLVGVMRGGAVALLEGELEEAGGRGQDEEEEVERPCVTQEGSTYSSGLSLTSTLS